MNEHTDLKVPEDDRWDPPMGGGGDGKEERGCIIQYINYKRNTRLKMY